MKNAALRGMPDVGNPYVRQEEGEVASARPRRGSLFDRVLTLLSAVVFASAGVQSSWAADYYAKNGGTIGQGGAIWYSASDPTATTVAGNNYWIVDGKWVNFGGTWYDYNLPGTLCIGGTPELCPWATSYSGVLQRGGGNYKLHPTAVNWYNGTIRTDARYAWQLSGVVNVLDGAAGKLIKVRTNDLTLDCSYSAGDIEVSAGRLIFSRKTTMPAGQKILVRDGATLVLNYAPGAKIVVSNRTSNPTANEIVLAEASGGIVGIPAVVGLRRDVKVRNGQLILIKPSLMVIFR